MKRFIALAFFAASCFTASAQQMGNISSTMLVSASRTAASVVTQDISNAEWRGAHIIVDMSAFVSGTYTPTIQGKDPASGKYYTILTGAAISSTSTVVFRIYPGLTAATNLTANDVLPRTWRVSFAGASTPSMTFSVGASFIQ